MASHKNINNSLNKKYQYTLNANKHNRSSIIKNFL